MNLQKQKIGFLYLTGPQKLNNLVTVKRDLIFSKKITLQLPTHNYQFGTNSSYGDRDLIATYGMNG